MIFIDYDNNIYTILKCTNIINEQKYEKNYEKKYKYDRNC